MGHSVLVVVHNRRENTRRNLSIEVEDTERVSDVTRRISNSLKIPDDELRVAFCGRVLESDTLIGELLLGPTTNLTALITEQKQLPARNSPENKQSPTTSSTPNTPQIGSFFAWCKHCNDVVKAKLRVYCSRCNSTSVVVKSEPQEWKDVLITNRIRADCLNCGSENFENTAQKENQKNDCFAVFRFKCVKCSELCAALSHIRPNWEQAECGICLDEPSDCFVLDFGCRHAACRECFTNYLRDSLESAKFIFRPPFGFTVTCPYNGCDFVVKDMHHMRFLGEEGYKKYQKIATEKLIALDTQGVFCPYHDCGASFFWDTEDNSGQTSCPECFRIFCRWCKNPKCICNAQEDASKLTIKATTKKCPNCSVDTEKSEGCQHMHCTNCGLDWCFRCVKPWTEDCQWDHWF
ncbi:hypothetical protein WR25_19287 [Diploscapter pachys]|uniref:E3 ubiquitin-protein ligase parkin n=1 Tax=Diploscapter pachys TaxID=2018661 RepID=A0A2A2JUH9_9BILA|nr:hypothetical protein WR25_19287 [Diploscapter pachys]